MKERPAIFTGESVRAILEGRKTQTRRVVKNMPAEFLDGDVAPITNGEQWAISKLPERIAFPPGKEPGLACPYGIPGDRLYVKETWTAAPPIVMTFKNWKPAEGDCYYRADGERPHLRWKSSMFMPRAASRMLLEIVSVRVERVQEISGEDAQREGISVSCAGCIGGQCYQSLNARCETFLFCQKDAYRLLWDKINGKKEGCSWNDNCFVWVIDFKRITP